jgi:hypothetical protein
MPAIRPGVPLRHHPCTDISPIYTHPGDQTPVVILCAALHLHAMMQHMLRQCLARLWTPRLANFRGIQPLQTHMAQWPAADRAHMQGVAVDHIFNQSCPGPRCICVSSYQNKSNREINGFHDNIIEGQQPH